MAQLVSPKEPRQAVLLESVYRADAKRSEYRKQYVSRSRHRDYLHAFVTNWLTLLSSIDALSNEIAQLHQRMQIAQDGMRVATR